jgi:(p)ppGpp synthase/HD superfamily hydrolase
MSLNSQAKKFAIKKHAHQRRKDGKTPYWRHLEQVVRRLEKLEISEQEVLSAGWLHDTIEDTDTDYDDIEERFGKKTADLVAAVTKDTRLPRKTRESQYILQLKNAPWQAKAIKLADIVANLADLERSGEPYAKRLRQARDKLAYYNAIKSGISKNKSRMPGLDAMQDELDGLLGRYGIKI